MSEGKEFLESILFREELTLQKRWNEATLLEGIIRRKRLALSRRLKEIRARRAEGEAPKPRSDAERRGAESRHYRLESDNPDRLPFTSFGMYGDMVEDLERYKSGCPGKVRVVWDA